MPAETDLLDTISRQVNLPPGTVLHVLDCTFRELHHRICEYDGVNGDYICEELIHELSEMAWIHLYWFVAFCRVTYGTDIPNDVMLMSTIKLDYLGGSDRWRKYLNDTMEWRMSHHLQNLLNDDE